MSLDNYVNNLYLAKSADSTDYSAVCAGDVADVVISAVYSVDYLTGIQIEVTMSWTTNSCDTDLKTSFNIRNADFLRLFMRITNNSL